jgi:hypothetical protein
MLYAKNNGSLQVGEWVDSVCCQWETIVSECGGGTVEARTLDYHGVCQTKYDIFSTPHHYSCIAQQLFRYHEDGSKKLNACSSCIFCMVYVTLNTESYYFTDHTSQYLHIRQCLL